MAQTYRRGQDGRWAAGAGGAAAAAVQQQQQQRPGAIMQPQHHHMPQHHAPQPQQPQQQVGSATRAAVQKSRATRAARAAAAGAAPAAAPAGGAGSGEPAQRMDRAGLKGKRGWAKKKGGGHGKFTWGRPGDETFMTEPELSRYDPNYDSLDDEDESNVIFDVLEYHQQMARKAGISLDGFQGGGHLFGAPPAPPQAGTAQRSAPLADSLPAKIPLKDFKAKCVELVDEFLTSEDTEELKDDLTAMHSPMLHYEFVRRAITLAMERSARERELISELLSKLYGARVLSSEQCGKGFERLFEVVEDLQLDIPAAKKYISQFLARAVADEILPPSFLSDPLIERLGGEVIDHAKVLLSIKHGLVRLDNVWGTTSAASVDDLKQEIKMLLQEFINSSDIDEACECIKRLGVPHFHHEVIKRAVVLSLDFSEREQAMMSSLLAELGKREIISDKQVEIGFRRLYAALQDLELDVPGASKILEVFINQAAKDNCLPAQTVEAIKKRYLNGAKSAPATN